MLKSLKKFHNTTLRMFCRVETSESSKLGLVLEIFKECSQYHTQNVLKREGCLNLRKLLTMEGYIVMTQRSSLPLLLSLHESMELEVVKDMDPQLPAWFG